MSYFHHNSMKSYTAALLDIFNDIEVTHKLSSGADSSKSIPIKFKNREKSKILDKLTMEQILSGNHNVLPRGNLALGSLTKSSERQTNKNLKINQYKTDDSISFQYNSVPYEFTYELTFLCRGMSEATQIVEQIAPKFNPILNIDIWDGTNLDEPTRAPVKLLDIDIETDSYEELSSNIITVSFGLSVQGNLYPPIKSQNTINEFQLRLNNVVSSDSSVPLEIMKWDVEDGNLTADETSLIAVISLIKQKTKTVILSSNNSNNIDDGTTYLWNMGDGNTFTSSSVNHTYSTSGNYVVSLTITNSDGQSDTATLDIDLDNLKKKNYSIRGWNL